MAITTIGLDPAKSVFQAHGVDENGATVMVKRLHRNKMLPFFSKLSPCLIGVEACGTAHYWARTLAAMGHEVRLIPPSCVKAYVKRGKSDALDAEAISEAVQRPTMRFVPVKTFEQQGILMSHRARS
jgi:transposase